MRKVISFSLWGDSKMYCRGAVENVIIAKKVYPDWVCRFYTAEDCPAIADLKHHGAEVVVMPSLEGVVRTDNGADWHDHASHIAMMWRFMAIDDCDADYVIFRDTDSIVNIREEAAVKEWIDSGKYAHRMHEVAEHWNCVMMGGMWGIKGGKLHPNLKISDMIERYMSPGGFSRRGEPKIFVDLYFIVDYIWPLVSNNCMGHGFGHIKPLPETEWDGMVGRVENEHWRHEKYVPTLSI